MTMLGYEIDWAVTAQMTTAVAAIIALFLGPFLGFQVSRRLAVSRSRQTWLDGVRSDLAQLIALHGDYVSHLIKQRVVTKSMNAQAADHMREIDRLLGQIRMRLNIAEPEQQELMQRISAYVACYDQDHSDYDPNAIYSAFDRVRDAVWQDIKQARV